MSQFPLSLSRLIWKDFRLIFPLVVLLLCLSAFFQLFYGFVIEDDFQLQSAIRIFLLAVPACYATGVGAILISREKETESLRWLRSLPIESQRIAASKLIVSIACLFLVWVVSLTLFAAIVYLRLNGSLLMDGFTYLGGSNKTFIPISILISIALLLIGNSVAWSMKSSIGGVVAILPLSVLLICIWMSSLWIVDLAIATASNSSLELSAPRLLALASVISFAVLGWLGWQRAMQYLNDGDEAQPSIIKRLQFLDYRTWIGSLPKSRPALLFSQTRLSFSSAMLWQFTKQNGGILVGILALLFVAPFVAIASVSLMIYYFDGYQLEPDKATDFLVTTWVLLLITSITCSWLGVIVFHTDSIARRARFFSERGVSPFRVWWTRQAIPLSIFALLGFAISLCLIAQTRLADSIRSINLVSGEAMILFGLMYSLSQWSSQLIRHSILAAVVTPFIVGVLVFYLFNVVDFDDSAWVMGLWLIIPMIATRVATRAWLDGDNSIRHWLGQSTFFAFILLLPLTQLIPMLMTPTMPTEIREKLYTEALKLLRDGPPPKEFGILGNHDFFKHQRQAMLSDAVGKSAGSSEEASQPPKMPVPKNLYDYYDYVINEVEQKLRDESSVLRPDRHVFRLLVTDATLNRLGNNTAKYQTNMDLLNRMSKRSRRSPIVADQDRCDLLDLWLLQQCQRDDAETNMGDACFESIVVRLADRDGRYQARRRAVLMSWASYEAEIQRGTLFQPFGGYAIFEKNRASKRPPSFLQAWSAKRSGSNLAHELVGSLDAMAREWNSADASSNRSSIILRVAKALNEPAEFFLASRGKMHCVADEMDGYPINDNFTQHTTCGLWFGQWEDKAFELQREMHK